MARIPYIYRFYFLFLDPVMAVSGSWLIYAQPTKFLASTTPASLNHLTSGPPDELITLLLTNIASLYIFFAIAESLVLLQTQDLKIWRTILAGILVSDLGHAYAVYAADPSGVLALGSWSMEEWINNGILIFGAVLRMGFLLGVGGVKQ